MCTFWLFSYFFVARIEMEDITPHVWLSLRVRGAAVSSHLMQHKKKKHFLKALSYRNIRQSVIRVFISQQVLHRGGTQLKIMMWVIKLLTKLPKLLCMQITKTKQKHNKNITWCFACYLYFCLWLENIFIFCCNLVSQSQPVTVTTRQCVVFENSSWIHLCAQQIQGKSCPSMKRLMK